MSREEYKRLLDMVSKLTGQVRELYRYTGALEKDLRELRAEVQEMRDGPGDSRRSG